MTLGPSLQGQTGCPPASDVRLLLLHRNEDLSWQLSACQLCRSWWRSVGKWKHCSCAQNTPSPSDVAAAKMGSGGRSTSEEPAGQTASQHDGSRPGSREAGTLRNVTTSEALQGRQCPQEGERRPFLLRGTQPVRSCGLSSTTVSGPQVCPGVSALS